MPKTVTKEMFESAKGLTIKTDQPFVKSRTPGNRKLALQEGSVKSSLKNIYVPIYLEEDIAFGVEQREMMGMVKVTSNLTMTMKFTDEKWKRLLAGVKAKKKFDKWWTIDYCGRCVYEEEKLVMKIDYFKLRPNVEVTVVPDKTLFGILTDELEKNFPKHECKERGAAIVLVANSFLRIQKELSDYYGRDVFLTEFLKRGDDDRYSAETKEDGASKQED